MKASEKLDARAPPPLAGISRNEARTRQAALREEVTAGNTDPRTSDPAVRGGFQPQRPPKTRADGRSLCAAGFRHTPGAEANACERSRLPGQGQEDRAPRSSSALGRSPQLPGAAEPPGTRQQRAALHQPRQRWRSGNFTEKVTANAAEGTVSRHSCQELPRSDRSQAPAGLSRTVGQLGGDGGLPSRGGEGKQPGSCSAAGAELKPACEQPPGKAAELVCRCGRELCRRPRGNPATAGAAPRAAEGWSRRINEAVRTGCAGKGCATFHFRTADSIWGQSAAPALTAPISLTRGRQAVVTRPARQLSRAPPPFPTPQARVIEASPPRASCQAPAEPGYGSRDAEQGPRDAGSSSQPWGGDHGRAERGAGARGVEEQSTGAAGELPAASGGKPALAQGAPS